MKNVAIALLAALVLLFAGLYVNGRTVQEMHVNTPVCHSVTEDSVMVDCTYIHGGWYRK